MSAVDVLRVLDKCHSALECGGLRHVLSEARAAVAELIAADEEYDAAHVAFFHCHRDDLQATSERVDAAKERRAAALARCKGETA